MDLDRLRTHRLASHRLTAPAATVSDAAAHMLAVQAQEFWGGRWALAARTRGAPSIRAVDAAFDDGTLVRSWTMRGTLHLISARDLRWVLSVTGERQHRQARARLRTLGLDDDVLARAEAVLRAALSGGGRLTRAEAFDVLAAGGVDPSEGRGLQLLYTLSVRGVLVQGPVIARRSGPTREQYLVLADEWIVEQQLPTDPLAELFVRYVIGHGPAGVEDFAWWAGLPLGAAREGAERADERVRQVEDGVFAASAPRRRDQTTPRVLALPSFEEYVISYVDRTRACDSKGLDVVIPGGNGIVRPVLVADGEVIGVWRHSRALGRHTDDPVPELFAPGRVDASAVAEALDGYAQFISG